MLSRCPIKDSSRSPTRRPYPLIAPAVKPLTSCFWNKVNITTIGSDTTTLAAIISGQRSWNSPMYVSTKPGGIRRISGLLVKVKAKTNSFQELRKAKKPTATTPGMMMGSTMDQSVPNRLEPSTRAASSKSVGSVSQKPLIIQILNGSEKVVNDNTRAG